MDKDVKDGITSLRVNNITFIEALNFFLHQENLVKKQINETTFLIYSKSKDKIDEYQELMIHTFSIRNAQAQDIGVMLRNIFGADFEMYIDKRTNSIIVRDNPNRIELVKKVIDVCDIEDAEVLLEIELIEINRSLLREFRGGTRPVFIEVIP